MICLHQEHSQSMYKTIPAGWWYRDIILMCGDKTVGDWQTTSSVVLASV